MCDYVYITLWGPQVHTHTHTVISDKALLFRPSVDIFFDPHIERDRVLIFFFWGGVCFQHSIFYIVCPGF